MVVKLIILADENPKSARLPPIRFNLAFPEAFGTNMTPKGVVQNMMLGRVVFHVSGTVDASATLQGGNLVVSYSYNTQWWIMDPYHFTSNPNESGDFWNFITWSGPQVTGTILVGK